jgi:hypothetical protein
MNLKNNQTHNSYTNGKFLLVEKMPIVIAFCLILLKLENIKQAKNYIYFFKIANK